MPLRSVASRTRTAVLGVMHLNKATTAQTPLYRVLGSIGFVGAARSVWWVTRPDEKAPQRLVLPLKANLCEDPQPLAFSIEQPGVLHWSADRPDVSAAQVMAAQSQVGRPSVEMDEAREWLEAFMADEGGEARQTDIKSAAKEEMITTSTLKRAKAELGIQSAKVGSGRGGYWVWKFKGAQS